jgi:hypothetical protein
MWSYFKGGKTSWESSFFGGLKRVLTEYPLYSLNYNIYTVVPESSNTALDLSPIQKDKLVNILFNEAFKILDYKDQFEVELQEQALKILNNEELLKARTVKTYHSEKIAVPVSKDVIMNYVKLMRSSELATLFIEYGQDLHAEGSEICVHLDVPKKSKDGTGDCDEPSDSEKEEQVQKQVKNFVGKYKDRNSLETLQVTTRNVDKQTRKSKINTEQVVFAKKLVNLLDITQDPKPEVIKNLLQGVMDDEKLPEILAGNNRIYMRRVENESVKPFKVVILGDYSGSMEGNNKFGFQKNVLKSLYYVFNDLLGIQDLEIYGHSGYHEPILYRFHSPEYPHFLETIDTKIELCENYDGPIIEHIHKMVRTKSDKAVLFISLSDGEPCGENYGGSAAIQRMKQVMEKIKRDNFVTVGVGMLYMNNDGIYQYSVTLDNLSKANGIAQVVNRAVKENLVLDE